MLASENYRQTSTSAVQQIGQQPSWSPSPMTPELADNELATKDLIAFTEYIFGRHGLHCTTPRLIGVRRMARSACELVHTVAVA